MATDSKQREAPAALMSPAEVAGYLGIPLGTLYQWRTRGEGPRGARIGKHVRYRREDVDAWIEAQYDPAGRGGDAA